ncbi:MAG: tellurite resistance TerB family protein [Methylophilaceae bacterium]|nr:tellurite resistance TerB family protein [Methylophilaceae bacterium]
MDLLGIVGLIIIYFFAGRILEWILLAVPSSIKAGYKSIKDGTSFIENYKDLTYKLGELEARINEVSVPLEDQSFLNAIVVQIRGLINKTEQTYDLQAVVSLFDITDANNYNSPILSTFEDLQEPKSRVMMVRIPLGKSVESLSGFTSWVELKTLFPDFMIGPKKGQRRIRGLIRVINDNGSAIDEITHGLSSEELLATSTAIFEFTANLKETGYTEAKENYFKVRAAFVEFGVLIAFADGNLDESEASTIKRWITHQVEVEDDLEDKSKLKDLLNNTLKDAFSDAKTGKISVTNQVEKFKDISTQATSLALLEFLFEIIGADGEISESELKLVNSIADKLGVSVDDVKALTDKTFLDTNSNLDKSDNAENILGITDSMDKSAIVKKLNVEFKKWNGRIQALEDGEEKEKAQLMLDVISEARKKYD